MSADTFEASDLLAELRDEIRLAGGPNSWAEQHGVSASYLSDVLNGRKKISVGLAWVLGYQRRFVFVRKTI